MLFMLLFLICVVLVTIVWKNKRRYVDEPRTHPGALPLIGNAHQLLGDSKQLWKYMKEISYFSLKSGGVSTVYLGPLHRMYIVTDPEDCLTLSNATFEKPFVYDTAREWVENGLIYADVPVWKRHRKMLNPLFSQQILNENLEVFNRQARRLVNQLAHETDKFDPKNYIIANSVETVCQIMLGIKEDEYESVAITYLEATLEMLKIFIAKVQKLWLHIPFIYNLSQYKKKLVEYIKITDAIIKPIIFKRDKELEKLNYVIDPEKTGGVRTYLDLMLALSKRSKGVLLLDDVRQHLELLIVTAYDTTAETLTFGLSLIGSNDRVQKRIQDELREVLGDSTRDVTRYDLQKLVYLDAVIKETLRMCPTVPLGGRNITTDIKLKNYTLRAGSVGVISNFGIARHPILGSDVEEFRPERWLDPNIANNSNLFSAFSLGKRNCIGKWYAMISMKTTLAHLFRHYQVKGDASKMVIQYDVSIRAESGHEIYLKKRENNVSFLSEAETSRVL